MRFLAGSLAAAVLAACGTKKATRTPPAARADAERERSLPTPPELAPKIEESVEYGYAIYLQDKASAIGTDVLVGKLGSLEGHGLGGYITIREGTEEGEPLPSWQVVFFTDSDPPAIKYVVHVPMEREKKRSFEERIPPERIPEPLLNLIRARQAAIEAAGPFTQPMNPVVMPAGALGHARDEILVELLAGTTEPNAIVLGKHFRVIVSPDGRHVESVMPLSKGALVLKMRDAEGQKIVAMYATNLVSEYPLETHVFASLAATLPLYLGTSRGVWLVDGDRITLISTDSTGFPPSPKK
jgi:hypothetical protein